MGINLKCFNTTPSHCCNNEAELAYKNSCNKIFLVGAPNVGKSALFNCLTGSHATVSNYPGTTISLFQSQISLGGQKFVIVDTPGMYSLLPVSDEERVTRHLLLEHEDALVIHVIDAKNIERLLPLTLQLIEANRKVILVLNMIDEAEKLRMKFDISALEEKLRIPVIKTDGIQKKGVSELLKVIEETFTNYLSHKNNFFLNYGCDLEQKITAIEKLLNESGGNLRFKALLLLQEDEKITSEYNQKNIKRIIKETQKFYNYPLFFIIAGVRQRKASGIIKRSVIMEIANRDFISDKLSRVMVYPPTGILILLLVLYVGLYKFVGVFGAGTLVDYIENNIFENFLNPVFTQIIVTIIPWTSVQSLFVGEYGILTLGVRYAIAIILPIVTAFFLFFSLIEDSGYLPRLAMLIDKVFKKIGLSGRAVIPLVLGLGCSTMATMVTRTLPTKREKFIATLLIALAVPCSAQLGVLLALLSPYPTALLVWSLTIIIVFLIVGYLGARLLPGEKPIFFMDVPPLRFPKIANIISKTYIRVVWYFKEVFPLFILASFFLWFGQLIGLLDRVVGVIGLPVTAMGLPSETARAFIFGFFRRDYGAAGLYDMQKAGLFTVNELTIAVVAMSLFPACIAQVLMMVKERGGKSGVGIFIFAVIAAFITGFSLKVIFTFFSISL